MSYSAEKLCVELAAWAEKHRIGGSWQEAFEEWNCAPLDQRRWLASALLHRPVGEEVSDVRFEIEHDDPLDPNVCVAVYVTGNLADA